MTSDISVVSRDLSKYNIGTVFPRNFFYEKTFSNFSDPKSRTCRCATIKWISYSASATPTYIYYIPTPYPSDTPFTRKNFRTKSLSTQKKKNCETKFFLAQQTYHRIQFSTNWAMKKGVFGGSRRRRRRGQIIFLYDSDALSEST